MKLFNSNLLKVTFFSLLFFFIGCRKEDSIKSSQKYDLKIHLLKMGVKNQDIKEYDEYLLVENDILIKKEGTDSIQLESYFSKQNFSKKTIDLLRDVEHDNEVKARQFSTNNLVNTYNIEVINISFSSGSYIYDWESPLIEAAKAWSNVSGCKVNFIKHESWYYTTNKPNSITVVPDPSIVSLYNAIAIAEFPSNGNPGYRIRYAPNFTRVDGCSVDIDRTLILAHEIGHCLGFRHSDWWYASPNSNYFEDDAASTVGANQIVGTPTQDFNSVMNKDIGFNCRTWSGLSQFDKIAVANLYPYQQFDNILTFPSTKYPNTEIAWVEDVYGNQIPITWNTQVFENRVVMLEVWQDGVLKGWTSNRSNTGSTDWAFAQYLSFSEFGRYATNVRIKIKDQTESYIFDYSLPFTVAMTD